MIIGVMVNAIATVKAPMGLWKGYELDLLHALAAAALAFTGPGAYALQRFVDLDLTGGWYGVGAVALGLVVGLLTLALRRVPRPAAVAETGQPQAA
jgi:putative oxidoreductase